MPGFEGTDKIILHQYDDSVPFVFSFPPCSTPAANDGAIPNGETISSAVVTVLRERSLANVTSQVIVGSPRVDSTSVTLALQYPSTSGAGNYAIRFVLTLTGGVVMEFYFDRLEAKIYGR